MKCCIKLKDQRSEMSQMPNLKNIKENIYSLMIRFPKSVGGAASYIYFCSKRGIVINSVQSGHSTRNEMGLNVDWMRMDVSDWTFDA